MWWKRKSPFDTILSQQRSAKDYQKSAEVCQSYGAPCHISFEDKMRVSIMRAMRPKKTIGNESALIQLAQCPFPGLAISNAKTLIYFFK